MAWQPPKPPQNFGGGGQQPPPPPPGGGGGGHSQPAVPTTAQKQTYYQLLQVDNQAHPTIIRYAYRFLAGMYHPDNAESGNTEQFRIVTDAFRTLSDPGKRAAYDAQVGIIKAPQPGTPNQFGGGAAGSGALPNIPKTGVSYNEVEIRLAVLQILLTARKKRAQTGGASAKVLMDVLGIEMSEMEFVLWYLREKGLITRSEAQFQIAVAGVDYLVDSLAKTQVIDDGGKSANISNIQLPATLGNS
jgi:curved DNA-binding protein